MSDSVWFYFELENLTHAQVLIRTLTSLSYEFQVLGSGGTQ